MVRMMEQAESEQDATQEDGDFASLYVRAVHIQNLRGIADCQIDLEPDLTVLVGPNNIGKSRLIRALALALGAVGANRDDFTVGARGDPTIDVVLAPRAQFPPNHAARVTIAECHEAAEKPPEDANDSSGDSEIFDDRRHLGYGGTGGRKPLLKFMKSHKGVIGSLLAAEMISQYPWSEGSDKWPEPLRELIGRLDAMLKRGD